MTIYTTDNAMDYCVQGKPVVFFGRSIVLKRGGKEIYSVPAEYNLTSVPLEHYSLVISLIQGSQQEIQLPVEKY